MIARSNADRHRSAPWTTLPLLLLALVVADLGIAQQCDDSNACTTSDMCIGPECRGSFQNGGSCDDGNPCTVDDRCQIDLLAGQVCRGVAAPHGTPCSGGCGTCQPVVGSPHLVICGGDPADHGAACDVGIGPCFGGSCVIVNFVASCFVRLKECPDTDLNPCTDLCDLETGECRSDIPKCVPDCERCNPSGACEPATIGAACDDGNVCTGQSRCEYNDVARRTYCVEGVPFGPSPTRTSLPPSATPQPTATASLTRTPSRTSTPTPTVPHTATIAHTPSASATQTVLATGTAPPTAAASTPTGSATVTAAGTPGSCIGDCDGDAVVIVSEVLLGINITLGRRQVDECSAFDADASAAIEVHELVGGVNALLNGCA